MTYVFIKKINLQKLVLGSFIKLTKMYVIFEILTNILISFFVKQRT